MDYYRALFPIIDWLDPHSVVKISHVSRAWRKAVFASRPEYAKEIREGIQCINDIYRFIRSPYPSLTSIARYHCPKDVFYRELFAGARADYIDLIRGWRNVNRTYPLLYLLTYDPSPPPETETERDKEMEIRSIMHLLGLSIHPTIIPDMDWIATSIYAIRRGEISSIFDRRIEYAYRLVPSAQICSQVPSFSFYQSMLSYYRTAYWTNTLAAFAVALIEGNYEMTDKILRERVADSMDEVYKALADRLPPDHTLLFPTVKYHIPEFFFVAGDQASGPFVRIHGKGYLRGTMDQIEVAAIKRLAKAPKDTWDKAPYLSAFEDYVIAQVTKGVELGCLSRAPPPATLTPAEKKKALISAIRRNKSVNAHLLIRSLKDGLSIALEASALFRNLRMMKQVAEMGAKNWREALGACCTNNRATSYSAGIEFIKTQVMELYCPTCNGALIDH